MPYAQFPTYKSEPEKMFEVPTPALGGINLRDLEFEQNPNQSPNMLNVMYRNGAFGKRYGQEVYATFADTVYAIVYFDGSIFVHSGTKIYEYDNGSTEKCSGLPESAGIFIVYAQKLYYLVSSGFYVLDNGAFTTVSAYVPDFLINCEADGSHSDSLDDLNLMSDYFSFIYNADGTSTDYDVGVYDSENIIDWAVTPTIEVDDVATTAFTVDSVNKKITFNSAPQEGSLNVKMTFKLVSGTFSTERTQILSCKFYDTFGGSNNSRLFIGGCGYSKYFYTQAYDISYFPESNFATLGNTEDDITGFGRQYNVLIVFKPREVYSIYSYTETSSTTVIEEQIGLEAFRSQLVNASIGCDAPHSIQLVNNLLTWFNSTVGVCTLVSTNIQDERNVRTISRNVDYTNNFGIKGIMDYDEDLDTIQSVDYNNRYFLVFPESGMCFMWDYEIKPYTVSSRGETDPKELCWFLFDNFYVRQFLKVGVQLIYASAHDDFNTKLIKLNSSFTDLDFDGDSVADPIHSYFMTPFMQFGSVEMLKNVKNIYVQCRGDVNSTINLYYYTNNSESGQPDVYPIVVSGNGVLWNHFDWGNMVWKINSWGNTLRRRCNLRHIQMCALFCENDGNADMSITNIGFRYSMIRYIH